MKSAAELVMQRTAPPPPAEPALPADWVFEPSPERIQAVSTINGGDTASARLRLIADGKEAFRQLCGSGAGIADAVRADFDLAAECRNRGNAALGVAIERLTALRSALVSRAELRQRIVETKAALGQAVATLADPKSIELPASELAMLFQRREHLPGEITALENGVEPITREIARLSGEVQIDVPAFVQTLYREAATRAGSGFCDPRVKGLVDSGFLTA